MMKQMESAFLTKTLSKWVCNLLKLLQYKYIVLLKTHLYWNIFLINFSYIWHFYIYIAYFIDSLNVYEFISLF